MTSAIDKCRLRIRRAARTAAWLTLACLGSGCEIVTGPHTRNVGELSRADRIDVSIDGAVPVATITDRQRVAATAAFVGRYRDGWINALSGNSAQRYLHFYDGERLLARIGVDFRAITDGGFARPLSASEVAELVDLLGISWPPPPPETKATGAPRREKGP